LSSVSSGSNGSGVVFGGTVLPSGVPAGCSCAVAGCGDAGSGSVGVSFPSGLPSVTPRLDKEIGSFSGFGGTGFSSGFGVTGC